jgi:hypothetical protein
MTAMPAMTRTVLAVSITMGVVVVGVAIAAP